MIHGVPIYDVDFYSDEVIADTYTHYAALRALGPVVWLPRNGAYALPRYAEVATALRNHTVLVSGKGVSLTDQANALLVGSTLNSDPPAHDLTRSVTSAPLLPGALQAVRPSIERAAEALIEHLVEKRSFDAVKDLAQYLPVTIVSELVGLHDAGPERMLEWAAATFDLFSSPNHRTPKALQTLKDLRAFLDIYGRPEKLKDGGWAKRIFEVGPERGIPLETCAQIMRDYINPSLDTTISAIGYAVWLFARNPEQWDAVRNDPALMPNAIEEIIRLASPIRAFSRYVAEDHEIAGVRLPVGSRVLVIYGSANRDELKWPDPNRFDVRRKVKDHVGFGSGVHMCMGMHLAKLEMLLLLSALARRVRSIEVTGPISFVENNTIHALAKLPVTLHVGAPTISTSEAAAAQSAWRTLVVKQRRDEATDIISLELEPTDGGTLASFTAGSHVDVRLRSGLVRQYSLSNSPAESHRYRLGVLREPASRGGSRAIHQHLQAGQTVEIGRPRNAFALVEGADHTILMAGGIGITPLLAMAHRLRELGRSFELHYCTRSRDRAAFTSELESFGDRVHLHFDDGPAALKLDIDAVIGVPDQGRHLYVCGPRGFMDFVVGAAKRLDWSPSNIHVEHFGAEIDTNGEPFIVVARRSGLTLAVRPGQTIASVLRDAGVALDMSCQSGVCGTCTTAVIEGTPDHRDLVQTEEEKATNKTITICCSRSKTRSLVLDI